MTETRHKGLRLPARLIGKQRDLARKPLQFTWQSLLIAVALMVVLAWLVQFLARTQPFDIPLAVHFVFLGLWTSAIVGAFVSRSAWWYFVGGIAGNVLASPLYIMMLYFSEPSDLDVLGVILFFMLYTFAVFACFSGAIWCFRVGRAWMGVENIAAFFVGLGAIALF